LTFGNYSDVQEINENALLIICVIIFNFIKQQKTSVCQFELNRFFDFSTHLLVSDSKIRPILN
jgi:hypothetical protein